ncbi:hypothetical protein ASL20_15510 [Cupriavidus necator]|uniref:Single-stranded DNA-binding protein n=2 Tax=Burkholderiaceae TaxID=119060 RepID=A0A643G235_9BURK|nr:hypothetical protein ASL20_15510 [Cupriavidus necator]NOV23500.1 hypothetical protein [Cupriavidus necator]QOT81886.1 single-stranded DNA-binding protein [Cupriavidus basilensis]
MRIEPDTLLERLREAGVNKADDREPVYEADVAALSALYRKLLGPRTIEIAAEVRGEADPGLETPAKPKVNRVILVGQLGEGPEVRCLPSDAPVANIRLAVAHRYWRLLRDVVEFGYDTRETRALLYLDLLGGHVPARLTAVVRRLVRSALRASIAESRRTHRLSALAAQVRSFLAGHVVSCHHADREATIHPAFAPPVAVI